MSSRMRAPGAARRRMLPNLGNAVPMEAVSDPPDAVPDAAIAAISVAMDQVGSRLRQIRAHRKITLVELSERTGISKSTLSRLENGQRRPTLELLLLLAQAYRVPLDDLVGAPDVGDPRIRLKPHRVKGRTVLPLTPPGGIQAWKILIPSGMSS